jgi:proline iminopeptidase
LYFHKYDPQVGTAIDENTLYSAAAYSHAFSKCLPTFNMLDRLGEITTPTLVLGGRYDWITPPAQGSERIHSGIPNSKLVIFENSGHFCYIEEHDKFVKVVSDWIARLP